MRYGAVRTKLSICVCSIAEGGLVNGLKICYFCPLVNCDGSIGWITEPDRYSIF